MIAVVARSYAEAKRFAKDQKLGYEGKDWCPVVKRDDTRGRRFVLIECVGNCWENREYQDIMIALQSATTQDVVG